MAWGLFGPVTCSAYFIERFYRQRESQFMGEKKLTTSIASKGFCTDFPEEIILLVWAFARTLNGCNEFPFRPSSAIFFSMDFASFSGCSWLIKWDCFSWVSSTSARRLFFGICSYSLLPWWRREVTSRGERTKS